MAKVIFEKLRGNNSHSIKKDNSVISLGGGAFLNNSIRKSVKKLSISFWLDASINELVKRLKKKKEDHFCSEKI